jgi:hypothetical protein
MINITKGLNIKPIKKAENINFPPIKKAEISP